MFPANLRKTFEAKRRRPLDRPAEFSEVTAMLLEDTYDCADESWRRIDGDWVGAAEGLTLDLNSDTHNTSLVPAFERADREVLLYPGDA